MHKVSGKTLIRSETTIVGLSQVFHREVGANSNGIHRIARKGERVGWDGDGGSTPAAWDGGSGGLQSVYTRQTGARACGTTGTSDGFKRRIDQIESALLFSCRLACVKLTDYGVDCISKGDPLKTVVDNGISRNSFRSNP